MSRSWYLSRGRDGAKVHLITHPWWTMFASDIVDRLCALTRHRFCHHLGNLVFHFADKGAEELASFDVTPEQLKVLDVDLWAYDLPGAG